MKGKVKFFGDKGYGFIAGDDGKEYFVHQSALAPGVTLRENDDVTFDVEQGDRGPKAANVKLGGAEEAPAAEAPAEEAPAEDEASEEDLSDDDADEEKLE